MNDSLKVAKKQLAIDGIKGTNCPCCGQFVKLYRRKFNTVMARGLISLHQLSKGHLQYYHVSDIMTKISPTGSNDFSKLRYHKMIEEEINSNPKKKTSGYWKITPIGTSYVRQYTTIQEYMLIYNAKLKRFEGDFIDIKQALGNKFDYNELMK